MQLPPLPKWARVGCRLPPAIRAGLIGGTVRHDVNLPFFSSVKFMKKARKDYSVSEPPDESRGNRNYAKKIAAYRNGGSNHLPVAEDEEFALCANDFEHICEERKINPDIARYGFASDKLQETRGKIIRELFFDLEYSWDHVAYAFDRPLSTLIYWEGKLPLSIR